MKEWQIENSKLEIRGYISIDKRLKMLLNGSRSAFYDQPLLNHGILSRISFAILWIKRKHKYKILKNSSSKHKFPQSPKCTKKYSSKYNGYRYAIIAKFRTCSEWKLQFIQYSYKIYKPKLRHFQIRKIT